MIVRPRSTLHAADGDRRRRVVDLERRAVELAGQRGAQRVRRRVRRDDLHEVGAVGDRRRVPDENRVGRSPCAASSTPFRLRAGRARRRPGRRRSRRRPSRRASAVPSDRCGGRAPTTEPGCALGGRRQLALRRRLIVEAGELRIAGRERLLKDDARRVDGDRAHLRPQVALQVGGGDRGEHRAVAFAGQHGAPLQVARLRAGDRRAVGVGVGRRPRAPGVVGRLGVARCA